MTFQDLTPMTVLLQAFREREISVGPIGVEGYAFLWYKLS